MADQSRSQENSESRKRHSNGKASESQESHTKPAASSAKRNRSPTRDKWEGKNPVLAMRAAAKKAGITFVEDPKDPMYTRGSSITFTGPTHHPSVSSSTNEAGPQTSSPTSETPTQDQ